MPYLAGRDPSCIKYDLYHYQSTIYTRELNTPPPPKKNIHKTKPMHLKNMTWNVRVVSFVNFLRGPPVLQLKKAMSCVLDCSWAPRTWSATMYLNTKTHQPQAPNHGLKQIVKKNRPKLRAWNLPLKKTSKITDFNDSKCKQSTIKYHIQYTNTWPENTSTSIPTTPNYH